MQRHDRSPRRADYALPRGARALQGTAPSKHWYAMLAVLACAGATIGFVIGRSVSDWQQVPARLDEATGRELARGPLADLLRGASPYVRLVADRPHDQQLWLGVERLIHAVLADAGHEAPGFIADLVDAVRCFAPPRIARFADELAERRDAAGRTRGD